MYEIVHTLFDALTQRLPANEYRLAPQTIVFYTSPISLTVEITCLIAYRNPAANPAGDTILLHPTTQANPTDERISLQYNSAKNAITIQINYKHLSGNSNHWLCKFTGQLDDPTMIDKASAILNDADKFILEQCINYQQGLTNFLNAALKAQESTSALSQAHRQVNSSNT